jgi:large subunit ribosomal protein L21
VFVWLITKLPDNTDDERGLRMYAIISIDGRQFKVEPGTEIEVGRLQGDVGDTVSLEDAVLFLKGDDKVEIGKPTVGGAKVELEILDHYRGEKVVVFKMKQRNRHRVKNGHRQAMSLIRVKDIAVA